MATKQPLGVGDTVRLSAAVIRAMAMSPEAQKVRAKIQGFYPDITGGVMLDTYIDGFRSWNVLDLVRIRRRGKTYGRKVHRTTA